ncbi:hypothetical protein JG688_00008485 [Phytophthora aleatoria]|uniref:Uncharacterized protein n=1 Tax=Phytophthora aleatoria TaxID=2496075 RepID=A0A8J5ING7_9STRA|nr:hypothetical protein JG688_00008485 [Phytophthora aleatoria]
MQGCFASLLRVRNGLYQFSIQYSNEAEFPKPLLAFSDPAFWHKHADAEEVIRRLSNASYKLKRYENTLANVVVAYRDI